MRIPALRREVFIYSCEGKVRMMQASLHHPSAPARVKYPAPLGRILPRNRKVPLEKLGHAPLLCSGVFDYKSSLSKRKSIKLMCKIPLSSYHRLPVSFLTTILGKQSPVSANGLSSVSAFSSVGIAYADCI